MARQSNAYDCCNVTYPLLVLRLLPVGRWIINDGQDLKLQGKSLCQVSIMHTAVATKKYLLVLQRICDDGNWRDLECSG